MLNVQTRYYWAKPPNLKLKTQPEQLLGSLSLDIALPETTMLPT